MSKTDIIAEANFRYAATMTKQPSKRFFLADGSRIDCYDTELVTWNGGHISIQFDLNSKLYSVELR